MLLRPIGQAMNGSGSIDIPSGILGGILISADSTNATTVSITRSDGTSVFSVVIKQPMFVCAPFQSGTPVTLSCTGTGGLCQLFEWLS